MKKLLHNISKHLFFTESHRNRKEAKCRIKFFRSLDYEVILKKWEHHSWGNNICATKGGFYGHISGVRKNYGFDLGCCDLKDGDILIYEVDEDKRNLSDGKRYDVGCLVKIQKSCDPVDYFHAGFVRICFTDDISNVKDLVNEEIKRLEQYL